jgi:hypothetical protein
MSKKEKLGELITENKENAEELSAADIKVASDKDTIEKKISKLIIDNKHTSNELDAAYKIIATQEKEIKKQAEAIIRADKEKEKRRVDLISAKKELTHRAELTIVNKELNQQITERKKAEKVVNFKKLKLELALQSSQMGTWELNMVENKLIIDNQACILLGIDSATFGGTAEEFFSVVHPDDREKVKEALKKTLEQNVYYKPEYRTIWQDGSIHHISARGKSLHNDKGNPQMISGIIWDNTEDKRKEEELKNREAKHSSMISNISDVIGIIGLDGRMKYKSPNIEKRFGWQPQDLIGTDGFSTVHPDDLERIQQKFVTILEKENLATKAEFRYKCKDGSYKPVEVNAINLTNDPLINGILLNYHDITERKQTETQLQRMQKLMDDTSSLAQVGGWEIDIETQQLTWTKQVFSIHEVDDDFVPTVEKAISFYTPESQSTIQDAIARAIEHGESYDVELQMITAKNNWRWVHAIGDAIIHDGKIVTIHGMFQDITDSKQVENLLKESEQKAMSIMENSADAIFIANQQGKYIYTNKEVSAMLGYTLEEMKSKTIADLTDPNKHEEIFKIFNQVLIEGKIYTEIELLKKDGNLISTDLNTILLPDGTVYGSCRDITGRKKAELELFKAKEKAEESGRLKSAFLANMSHEIRTPMNGILGFTSLLKEPNLSGEKVQKYISIIEKSGKRMLNTIGDLMNISMIESGQINIEISEIKINKLTNQLFAFFEPEAKKKGVILKLNNTLSDEKATLLTDKEKIYSILTNLIKNAIKYSKRGSIEFGYLKKAKYLEFFIKDTGIGIPKDRQQAIFDRFVQADIEDRDVYEGNGLGLSISKAYVEMLGGKIWVESEKGLGSTFYFTIPYTTELKEIVANINDNVNPKKEVQVKNLKILIVDDDETSDLLMSIMLTEISREILHARSGLEAIELCRNNPDTNLILMDIKMSRMGGYEATRQIRQFNKDIIVIAQTAYGFTGDREKAIEAGCNEHISKPIIKNELMLLIQQYFIK